jgi:2-polyprenyl-3-methyl-5-hydroxy-6-metoxy-1,4-benzoquinol methylase
MIACRNLRPTILLLDALEHLHDSLGILKEVSKLLEPGGHVIVSVPNVAHLNVAIPLLWNCPVLC